MTEADGWTALGLSLDEQCAVIAERMAAGRARDPAFRIRSFGYFTEAIRERAERRKAGGPPPGDEPCALHRKRAHGVLPTRDREAFMTPEPLPSIRPGPARPPAPAWERLS